MSRLGEFQLIDRLHEIVRHGPQRAEVGIGDDAAVLSRPEGRLLFCSDAMVEGIHFDLRYTRPDELGHKALASCLSDIAAMRGRPIAALISIAVPPSLPPDFLTTLYVGLQALATRFNTQIVGGDTTSSRDSLFLDVCVLGTSSHPALRSGARPGDLVAVTGCLGTAAAGLSLLQKRARDQIEPALAPLAEAHLRPIPRLNEIARLEPPGLITSLIDVSDGLSSECHHLAKASGVSLEISAAAIPLSDETRIWAQICGEPDPLRWALDGGEDFELLMTLDPATWSETAKDPQIQSLLTVIGRVQPEGSGVTLVHPDGRGHSLFPGGWDHFPT